MVSLTVGDLQAQRARFSPSSVCDGVPLQGEQGADENATSPCVTASTSCAQTKLSFDNTVDSGSKDGSDHCDDDDDGTGDSKGGLVYQVVGGVAVLAAATLFWWVCIARPRAATKKRDKKWAAKAASALELQSQRVFRSCACAGRERGGRLGLTAVRCPPSLARAGSSAERPRRGKRCVASPSSRLTTTVGAAGGATIPPLRRRRCSSRPRPLFQHRFKKGVGRI